MTIPGHGECLLDRFDSLILVAPAVFIMLFFCRIRLDQPARIITGG